MLNSVSPEFSTAHDGTEQSLKRYELTAAAIRLGIGVDGVRRRLQRGSLQGVKEDGKWFVLLPAELELDGAEQAAEQPTQSAEHLLNVAEQHHRGFLEAENGRLWKELEERRREVSELHILLKREQERNDQRLLGPPGDYVEPIAAEPFRDTAEQPHNKKGFWQRLFGMT